jgi:N-acetylmuramoyl-L-alanine amidase
MLHAARSVRAFCSPSRRTPAWLECVTWSAILLLTVSVYASSTGYEHAERMRENLDARPESQRSRLDYSRVLYAFRAIYHDDPASPKADASVLAVAELLAEEGRVFSDKKLLHDAVGQYAFLRLQYPGTRYRFSALLSEGEIYRRDIGDRDQAKQTFQLFLASYPENPLAEQARIELNDIIAEEHAAKRQAHRSTGRNAVLTAANRSQPSLAPTQISPAMTPPAIQPQQVLAPSRPPPAMTPPAIQPQQVLAPSRPTAMTRPAIQPSPPVESANENAPIAPPPPLVPGHVSLVSGIRHWSTPVYTRIAIDLQDQVAYQAARVPGPDRIYFDLYGARLEPGLNGRSVEVIDDGFLKRIRAAQFSNNVTRIVLDVSSVSDYSAFLLPNPWRLIIDVHGLKAGAAPTTVLASLPPEGAARGGNSSTNALSSQPTTPPAAPSAPVPPPVASQRPTTGTGGVTPAGHRSGSGPVQEIASLDQQPDRIRATDRPTTGPIADSVAGTVQAPQADDGSLASTTTPLGMNRGHKKPSPLHPAASDVAGADDNLPPAMREAEPTAAGERSLVRTLGLKIGRIVIDAGHGGHDTGTLGPGGVEEKEIVLDVALRLGKLLKQRLGADVIFTRDNDTFVPLETRTAIANKAQADLFLSIHANSSSDSSARGVETYYLNFTTSPDALEVAARENAVSDESIHELSDLVKKITLKDKIDESREFATDVQKSLYDDLEEGNPGLRDRGVKKAPFVVLIGANMPSILAEISFLTNADDARQLQQPAYRQRIAESLYRGVARYISGLSGVRLAQSLGRPSGN